MCAVCVCVCKPRLFIFEATLYDLFQVYMNAGPGHSLQFG